MSRIDIIEEFLADVEIRVFQRMRENMKHAPYKRLCEYYPEVIAEVLNEMERTSGSDSNTGLEDTQKCLPGVRGSA
jgi:hypothetical protein